MRACLGPLPLRSRLFELRLEGADTVDAFSSALHLVFLIAALIAAFAFVLSFFLREVPLRRTVAAAHRQGEDQRA